MVDYDFERAEWLYRTSPPINGPAWNPRDIKYFNIHYTGASSSYAGKSEQATLNSIQKDYQNNRGYSFGYSCAVGLSGMTYEGRGTDFRAASNGMDTTTGDDLFPGNPKIGDNLEVFSCLLIVGVPDPISDKMINGVRRLYKSVCDNIGKELIINGHRDMGSTACPGDKAYLLVRNKSFYPISRTIKDDMETLRAPRRIVDTRTNNSPVTGSRSFDLKSGAATIIDAEVTVTCIPNTAQAGYAGLNSEDSFCNWTDKQKGIPLPQTLRVPINNKAVSLYFSTQCHVIITVRAEG